MPKKDACGSWTIKSPRLDEELKTVCRIAADRQGMELAQWVIEMLHEKALAVITSGGATAPPPNRRAHTEDLATPLLAMMQTLAETVAVLARAQAAKPASHD